MTSVGVIANPASGRDIRRLVTGASVFDNSEKGSMVFRLLIGLGAVGVEKVWMMPAGEGLSSSLLRHLGGRTERNMTGALPHLEFVDIPMHGEASDSTRAAEHMKALGVEALVVLGGDGTNRVVAKGGPDVPLCALSTGTNNAFPSLHEATVAGIATGLVATKTVDAQPPLVRRAKRLDVHCGAQEDTALVDVVASSDRFVGARALWRVESLSEAVVAFADPAAVGLAGVAGSVDAIGRDEPGALYLRLGPPEAAEMVVTAALAPGLVADIGISGARRIDPNTTVAFAAADGCLALDGERELERTDSHEVTVTLAEGPLVIDVVAVMRHAAATGQLHRRSKS